MKEKKRCFVPSPESSYLFFTLTDCRGTATTATGGATTSAT